MCEATAILTAIDNAIPKVDTPITYVLVVGWVAIREDLPTASFDTWWVANIASQSDVATAPSDVEATTMAGLASSTTKDATTPAWVPVPLADI